MDLETAIKHIIDGNGVLFLGAGFSKGAINIQDNLIGDASELSKLLCETIGIEPSNNLGAVSGYYLQSAADECELNKRKKRLVSSIQNLFFTKEVKEYHKEIVNFPWRRIYTTNYDDVVEFAHQESIETYTMDSDLNEIIKRKCIVHLNGNARTVTEEKIDNEFKLTNRSYLVEDFLNSNAKKAFDHDVKNSKVIIIIGTSFNYDLDIQRVLYSSADIKNKTIFIDRNGKILDPLENAHKKLIGEVYNIGTDKFSILLNEFRNKYIPTKSNYEWKSFDLLSGKFNNDFKELKERDNWDLLITGDINQLLINANKDNNNYLIQRTVLSNIKQDIKKKHFKVGIIHSNLGNGKTCAVNLLAYQLTDRYKGFIFKEYNEDWGLEVERINNEKGYKLVIIENYQNHLELIAKLMDITDSSTKLILTSRTFVNNSTYYNVEKKLKKDEFISEYDINFLDDIEIKGLSKYLNERKLDKIFDLPQHKIEKVIKQDCNRRMSDVLLYIIESKAIKNKLDNLLNPTLKDPTKRDLLLAIMINNTCSLDLEFSDIVTILGKYTDVSLITRDQKLSEFIDINNNKIKMKSAVLSRYIVVSKELNKDIIRVMEHLVLNANKVLEQKKCDNIRKLLISISNIREMLVQTQRDNEEDINDYILEYFDKLPNLKEFKENIFFWLQYAMACLDTKQFDRAEVYFNNAYKLTYNGFNTYQIDTQYGRYLLELGIEENLIKNSYYNFKEAIQYWKSAIMKRPTQSYYVFKQLYLFEEYIEKYVSKWNVNERGKVLEECKYFEREIRKNSRNYRFLGLIKRCTRKVLLTTTKV